MRSRQIRALLWELWARNRFSLAATVIGVPLLLLGAQQIVAVWPAFQVGYGLIKLLAIWSIAYLVMIFSYAEFSAKSLQTGFPRHVMKLPAPTWLLLATPLTVAVCTVYSLAIILTSLMVDQSMSGLDYCLFFLAAIVAMSWMQAINWGLNRTPIRAAIVVIVVLALTGAAMVSTLSISGGPIMPFGLALITLLLLALVGVSFAYWTLKRVRCGQTIGQTIFWSDFTVPGFAMRRLFRSPEKAQFWYEWRVFGSLLPLAALFFGALLFFAQFLPSAANDSINATAIVIGMFLYIATLAGFELGKSHVGASDRSMTGFWASRPLGSHQLAFAKVKVAGFSVALAWLLCFIPLVAAWWLTDHAIRLNQAWLVLRSLHGFEGALVTVFLAASVVPVLAWVLCGNSLAVGMIGNRRTKRTLAVAAVATIVTIGFAAYRLSLIENWTDVLLTHYPTVFAMLAVIVSVGFILLLRAFVRIAPWSSIRSRFVATLICAGLVLAATSLMDGLTHFPFGFLSLTIVLSLLSLYPWLLAPIALHNNRHL
ncbi:MAG: hypothetical protein DHS20C11_02450 [Lysobacteraceae bacterium]|nr:MAG: hypothetical protein DHS20C11_02450 [Xanthomonadaceae bacterium]